MPEPDFVGCTLTWKAPADADANTRYYIQLTLKQDYSGRYPEALYNPSEIMMTSDTWLNTFVIRNAQMHAEVWSGNINDDLITNRIARDFHVPEAGDFSLSDWQDMIETHKALMKLGVTEFPNNDVPVTLEWPEVNQTDLEYLEVAVDTWSSHPRLYLSNQGDILPNATSVTLNIRAGKKFHWWVRAKYASSIIPIVEADGRAGENTHGRPANLQAFFENGSCLLHTKKLVVTYTGLVSKGGGGTTQSPAGQYHQIWNRDTLAWEFAFKPNDADFFFRTAFTCANGGYTGGLSSDMSGPVGPLTGTPPYLLYTHYPMSEGAYFGAGSFFLSVESN